MIHLISKQWSLCEHRSLSSVYDKNNKIEFEQLREAQKSWFMTLESRLLIHEHWNKQIRLKAPKVKRLIKLSARMKTILTKSFCALIWRRSVGRVFFEGKKISGTILRGQSAAIELLVLIISLESRLLIQDPWEAKYEFTIRQIQSPNSHSQHTVNTQSTHN